MSSLTRRIKQYNKTLTNRAEGSSTRFGPIADLPQQIYEILAPREAVLTTVHATHGEHEYVINTERTKLFMPAVAFGARWEDFRNASDSQ